jgi:hypothetical protein
MFASNDGTNNPKITDAQRAIETRLLKTRLQTLEKSLDQAVRDCLSEMNETLVENIFDNFQEISAAAASRAVPKAASWGAPVNKVGRPLMYPVLNISKLRRKIVLLEFLLGDV